MTKIIICARTMRNTVELLKPGVLVVTPGDRDDIILAVSLAAINGVPLAGLLLTSDTLPDPRIMDLCRGAFQAGLPVLSVSTGSYDTANQLNSLNKEIPIDDRERAEIITDFVASHLDASWLHQRCGTPREMRLSPAVFRYQLIQRAQAANKRIVLPEGSEPLDRAGRRDLPGPRALPVACCWPNLPTWKPWPAPRASSCPGAGDSRPGPDSRALCRADGRTAQEQEPQRADGRAATGRHRGDRHHDARAG